MYRLKIIWRDGIVTYTRAVATRREVEIIDEAFARQLDNTPPIATRVQKLDAIDGWRDVPAYMDTY